MNRPLRFIFPIVFLGVLSPVAKSQDFAKLFDVTSYSATVKLDRQTDSLWGVVTMHGVIAAGGWQNFVQHAMYLTIDSVRFAGHTSNGNETVSMQAFEPLAGDTSGAWVVEVLPKMWPGDTFSITTYYHGRGQTEQQGSLHWGGVSDFDTMMFAMGVGFNAPYTSTTRHWLPCYDLPDDKPDSVDLTFITNGEPVASNGLLVSDKATDQTRVMHWHVGHPIATYLLTFATGPYVEQNIPNRLNMPFEVYSLRRDSALAAKEMNGRVANVLAFYDSLFAPYPFEKIGYVVTPIGSMEHQTMICLDKRVLGNDPATATNDGSTTAAHELAHMWWGDWVTCKTFDDAWLNEGFARFSESLVLEHLFGHKTYGSRQRSNISSAKTSKLSLFGAPTEDNHNSNYPSETIYNKGAAVLGMLREFLGDSIFFTAVRYYGNKHAYSTATSADMLADFNAATGLDLTWFWKQWVYGRGYPTDTITWTPTANGATITFHQRQVVVSGPDKTVSMPFFRVDVPVYFSDRSGRSTVLDVWMDSLQTSTANALIGFVPDTVKIDPEGLMLMTTVKVTQVPSSEVAPQHDDGRSLVVFPNPNNRNVLTCRLIDSKEGAVSFSLIDATGRSVHKWNCPDASLTELLPMRGIPSGTYRIVALFQSGDSLSTTVTIEH